MRARSPTSYLLTLHQRSDVRKPLFNHSRARRIPPTSLSGLSRVDDSQPANAVASRQRLELKEQLTNRTPSPLSLSCSNFPAKPKARTVYRRSNLLCSSLGACRMSEPWRIITVAASNVGMRLRMPPELKRIWEIPLQHAAHVIRASSRVALPWGSALCGSLGRAADMRGRAETDSVASLGESRPLQMDASGSSLTKLCVGAANESRIPLKRPKIGSTTSTCSVRGKPQSTHGEAEVCRATQPGVPAVP